jgi:hypothetical protein
MSAAERAAVAHRIAVRGLDHLGWAPERFLGHPEPLWRAIGEAMAAEVAARTARAGFRAIRGERRLPLAGRGSAAISACGEPGGNTPVIA